MREAIEKAVEEVAGEIAILSEEEKEQRSVLTTEEYNLLWGTNYPC